MLFEVGELVSAWDGDCRRYGRYLGTIERGKPRWFGWRRVEFRELNGDGEFVWRERRVAPDSVHKVEVPWHRRKAAACATS